MSCCFQRPDVAWFLSCDIRHSFAIHLKLAILFIRDLIWNAFFASRAINYFPIVKPRSNIPCLSWTNMLPCCTSVQCTIAHPIHMKIQQSWLFIPDILWGINDSEGLTNIYIVYVKCKLKFGSIGEKKYVGYLRISEH